MKAYLTDYLRPLMVAGILILVAMMVSWWIHMQFQTFAGVETPYNAYAPAHHWAQSDGFQPAHLTSVSYRTAKPSFRAIKQVSYRTKSTSHRVTKHKYKRRHGRHRHSHHFNRPRWLT